MIHEVAIKAASKGLDWAGMGQSAVKVFVVGLVFGAGLPALFSVGMKLWDAGSTTTNEDGTVSKGNPATMAAGAICFLVVVLAVLAGLGLIMQKTIKHYTGIELFPGLG